MNFFDLSDTLQIWILYINIITYSFSKYNYSIRIQISNRYSSEIVMYQEPGELFCVEIHGARW